MRQLCLLTVLAAGGCLLLSAQAAQAIINADNTNSTIPDNTSAPSLPPASDWNNVGQINGGSGIYLGNSWVLTADHVGAGNINFDGTTYNWNGQPEIRLNNPDTTAADLIMFKLTAQPTGLSSLMVANTSPTTATQFYNVGYGVARNTAEEYYNYNPITQTFTQTNTPSSASYGGFGYGSTYTKSWGQNTVAGTTTYNLGYGEVNAFYSTFTNTHGQTNTPDQIINGDSGGGVFNSLGQLIGVNDAIGTFKNQPASTVLFGNQSDIIDIAPFYSQIMSTVPEPASLLVLLCGLSALALRRRLAH